MTPCSGKGRATSGSVAWVRRATRRRRVVSRRAWAALVLALTIVAALPVWAQEVGTVAELEGTVQIGRAGTWGQATIGAAIAEGDTLRTGRPGRLAVVFQDDSVVTMADDSELVIDEQVFERAGGSARSVMRLLGGRIRALVSAYYERPGTEFRVETKTAVVGVRGTEFVIAFNPVADVTDAVGVSGRAEVHSVLDRVGHAVFITARQATTVNRGQYPTPARRLDDESFRQYMQGLQFIGHGKLESLTAVQPVVTGSGVPLPDRLSSLPAPPVPVAPPPAGGIAPSAPAETTHDAFAGQNVGGLVHQPPAVLEVPHGRVGLHF